ncbi:putative permease, cadmium resistance protein [Cylindrospermum stagnale PCC 7417]|uniref:Putative permease, cadmium resistance protein n=1 Tax=Cylindrospermum stagnale PCC 7417 TaxID=56107 RepID=K9WZF3_9NOST|nr:cadmium resistance transporter [Cylindrospermum stagnale]AFZ24902.1 putative permease, cadmium resistance protein [Cylindrospermum stagnale PCC 7417]
MRDLGTAFSEGIIAFAATNIDDLIILLLFFSQIDANFRRRHIFIGQYLGFATIIIASLPGYFGGLIIQRELIGLLGLLPIAIGIKQLLHRKPENTEVQTVTTDFKQSSHPNPILSFILSILHPQTYKVAAVTLANGGDNIGIYIPLFAGHDLTSLGVILSVFFFMVGVWCAIAYLLTRQPSIANVLSRYGKAVVPFVLIGLGLFIMYERGTFNLLPWL